MTDQPHVDLNDGRRMPQLGLGVWRTANDEAAQVVTTALDAGYLAVDTASIYRNEPGVGEGLAGRRVFLTTKLWNDAQGYDATLRAFDESARRLEREVIDLYLIHWPAPRKGLYLDTWKAFLRLREEGRVTSIGVSNFNADHLRHLIDETGVTPAVNQIELHPSFQQKALRKVHEELGVATESWSPLGQAQALKDPVVASIAQKHGRTPAQVVIRWHLGSGLIVIPKSSNPQRIRENVDVFDFRLDAQDMAEIAALDREDGRIGDDPMTSGL